MFRHPDYLQFDAKGWNCRMSRQVQRPDRPRQAIVSGSGASPAGSNGYPWNGRCIIGERAGQAVPSPDAGPPASTVSPRFTG